MNEPLIFSHKLCLRKKCQNKLSQVSANA